MSDRFASITKNRAEEIGYNVWDEFVLPPYFNRLDIFEARKPRIFIGGRGCGKTMLIRYLSHVSQFSKKKTFIEEKDIEHIGLYWRMDTQFASMMEKRNIPDDIWINAFTHFATIQITIEVLKSLLSIADSNFPSLTTDDLIKLTFDDLKDFDSNLPNNFEELLSDLKGKQRKFHGWLNNAHNQEYPVFLPKDLIITCISSIKQQLPVLSESIFFVYMDEYENLLNIQKQVVNTWLKHSEMPLIFNLAMKRNSHKERESLGIEQISNVHDFRVHDLEKFFEEGLNFNVFVAEVLFLRLQKAGIKNLPINEEILRDPKKLNTRAEAEYEKTIIEKAKEIFPGSSTLELAKLVFNDKILKKRLRDNIESALKSRSSTIDVSVFIVETQPQAAIIIPALLYRTKNNPETIYQQIDKLNRGEPNDFISGKEWIHNMFYGCFIMLYAPLNRICPIYSGFDTFVLMSKGNLRHFLELCHKSLSLNEIDNRSKLVIDQSTQNEAAKQAGTSLLGEIKSFGRLGNKLHTFLVRLGYIMYLSHMKPKQSEPEMTHFGITTGSKELSLDNKSFLEEAVKWSVLFEIKPTKIKNSVESEQVDYLINPIYAPYFSISYRKGRKLDITTDQLDILINGDFKSYKNLHKKYTGNWNIMVDKQSNPTYSQLNFDVG